MNETIAQPLDALPDVAALQRRVAELEQTLTTMHARETRYQRLVEGATDLFSCHGPDGAYRYISPACHHLLGYTPDELLGHQPYELFHPDDQAAFQDALTSVLDPAQPMTVTVRHRRKDGTYVWLETTSRAIGDPATGAVVEVHASSRDVSARKHAEADAQAARDHLHTLLTRLDQCVWSLDLPTNTFLYLSPACERIYGVSPMDLHANPVLLRDHIHPDDQGIAAAAEAALMDGEVVSSEYRVIRADGAIRWVVVDVKPALDAQGQLMQLDGIVTDVTARKVADLERERMQEVLIQLQQAALAELSTPLIPIDDEIVVMPLIGTLDTQRAQQVLETMLQGVERSRARVVILDITGVPIMDTQVAHTLIQAAQAVKLLGAQVVLTGIRPEVAQTLVTLGVDLRSIVTHSSLQRGIAYATAR